MSPALQILAVCAFLLVLFTLAVADGLAKRGPQSQVRRKTRKELDDEYTYETALKRYRDLQDLFEQRVRILNTKGSSHHGTT